MGLSGLVNADMFALIGRVLLERADEIGVPNSELDFNNRPQCEWR